MLMSVMRRRCIMSTHQVSVAQVHVKSEEACRSEAGETQHACGGVCVRSASACSGLRCRALASAAGWKSTNRNADALRGTGRARPCEAENSKVISNKDAMHRVDKKNLKFTSVSSEDRRSEARCERTHSGETAKRKSCEADIYKGKAKLSAKGVHPTGHRSPHRPPPGARGARHGQCPAKQSEGVAQSQVTRYTL